jgi:hypothetical protein
MCKLTNLHQRYQIDGACIVKHGINFKMAAARTQPEDLFPGVCSSKLSAGHIIHEFHNRYQQGGTITVAFSQLSSYVLSIGVNQTRIGWWSWIQVRTGVHQTQIVLAYQSCRLSGCQLIGQNGLMKGRGAVAAQHKWCFQMKGNFNKPRKVFSTQLLTQLREWQAVGEEIILCIDVYKNLYTSPLAKVLLGEVLMMEENTLWSTGREAPHSHCTGKAAIVGTYATPGIICTNSYLSPHGTGVGNHWFQLHDFDAHTILGTVYPKTFRPNKRALCCGVEQTVEQYNEVLRQLLIWHQLFEKLEFLQNKHRHMSADDFQLMFNKWDKKVTQIMLGSEKQCNKFWNGSIKFNPIIGTWI